MDARIASYNNVALADTLNVLGTKYSKPGIRSEASTDRAVARP